MKRKRLILLSATITIGIFALFAAYTLKTHPRYYKKIKYYIKSILRDDSIDTGNTYYKSKIKNDRYSLHRRSAVSSGVTLIKNNRDIQKDINKGSLINVKNGDGYKIHRLNYSKAVLSKRASAILKRIGNDFYNKTSRRHYFMVTSLTRTVESQKRLSKHNVNATRGISTHCYGVSFDISYIRFDGKKRRNAKLQKELEEILIQYQKKKEIYIIREKVSNCYHITIR